MNSFGHFLLTRFNVLLPNGSTSEPTALKNPGVDGGWLGRRFDLFEHVCLPSVARQTEGAFQWLVFMDWATPLAFKERMAALTVRHEFLRPVYCSQFNEAVVMTEIRRREAPAGFRITTRIDSDEALHPRMIGLVQQLARKHLDAMDPKNGFLISFPTGCFERNGDFYVRRDRTNPFKSFVSATECDRTVLGDDPSAPAAAIPVVCESTRPMWCQVLHDENSTRSLRGVYWPWGGDSEFAPVVSKGFCRPLFWQCAEMVRSATQYLRNR